MANDSYMRLLELRFHAFTKDLKNNKQEEESYIGKYEIPTHDPQTGEINVEYEALTGKKNPLMK